MNASDDNAAAIILLNSQRHVLATVRRVMSNPLPGDAYHEMVLTAYGSIRVVRRYVLTTDGDFSYIGEGYI